VVRHKRKQVKPWHIAGAMDFRDALAAGRPHTMTPVALKPEDLAFLQYTGGTTGISKGAMLTHRNIVANLLQARAWVGPFLAGEREVIITPLPMYHILSLTANCLVFMTLGGENVLIPNPRDIGGLIKEMGRF